MSSLHFQNCCFPKTCRIEHLKPFADNPRLGHPPGAVKGARFVRGEANRMAEPRVISERFPVYLWNTRWSAIASHPMSGLLDCTPYGRHVK